MTRDDVIRMAAEACGEFRLTGAVMFGADELQLFAEKVADSVIESVAQHLETSSDRHRRDYFAAKVRELKTQAPAQPAGQDRIDAEQPENAFQIVELSHFRRWLKSEYNAR